MTYDERMEYLSGIGIGEVGLSVRACRCLTRAGLVTLADVARLVVTSTDNLSHAESAGNFPDRGRYGLAMIGEEKGKSGWIVERKGLLAIRNLGKMSALEVLEKLEECGMDIIL